MNIRIEDLDLMDFSEVVDPMADRLPLIHPGEILHEDFLKPLGVSQYALAKAIDVPPRRINEIIKGQRGITVDTALRLATFFGTDAQSWLNLQNHYDTERARDALTDILSRIPRCERWVAQSTKPKPSLVQNLARPLMIQQINIHEAKTQLSRLIERSLSGEEFIIAKAGKPVARLTPIKPARQPRRLGLLDGELQIPDDFNAPLPETLLSAFEGRG